MPKISCIPSIDAFCALHIMEKVEKMQFLSKELKLGRGFSHPERDIGKTTRKRKNECANNQSEEVSQWVIQYLPQILSTFKDARNCHRYFLLSLLLDVLKFSPTTYFALTLMQYTVSLQHDITLYAPNLQRYLDIYDKCILFAERQLDLCDAEIVLAYSSQCLVNMRTLLRSHFALKEIHTARMQQLDTCVFIDQTLVSSIGSTLIISMLRLVNIIAEKFPSSLPLHEAAISCTDALYSTLTTLPLSDLLHSVAECDTDIVKFLLEICRYKALHPSMSSTASTSIPALAAFCPTQCFVIFAVNELCLDIVPLIDLITGTETDALLLVMRILKGIVAAPDAVSKAVNYLNQARNPTVPQEEVKLHTGEVSIFVCSEQILKEEESLSLLSTPTCALMLEVNLPVNVSVPPLNSCARISVHDIVVFFETLHQQLASMMQKNMFPFNCSALLRRLSESVSSLEKHISMYISAD